MLKDNSGSSSQEETLGDGGDDDSDLTVSMDPYFLMSEVQVWLSELHLCHLCTQLSDVTTKVVQSFSGISLVPGS